MTASTDTRLGQILIRQGHQKRRKWDCGRQFLGSQIIPGPAHQYLLEVGSKAVHVLIIGQHGLGLTPEAVDVPDPKQGQQDRGILL